MTATPESIIAPSIPEYHAAVRDQERMYARNHAAQPRRLDVYARFVNSTRLLFRIRMDPNDSLICRDLIRDLCEWRRWAKSVRRRGHEYPPRYTTAGVLIRAELARIDAAKHIAQGASA